MECTRFLVENRRPTLYPSIAWEEATLVFEDRGHSLQRHRITVWGRLQPDESVFGVDPIR